MPDEDVDSKATDLPSGLPWLTPFAYFDPDSSSWRMCQGSLLEDSGESCTTWPKKVTWDRQFVYQLETWAPPTYANASSSLLPTPGAWLGRRPENSMADPERARSRENEGMKGKRSFELPDALATLPTPAARDAKGPHMEDREGGLSLGGAMAMLPTPMANPENPGSGGELRAALTHGEGRRNETGTDTWGRPNRGRGQLLPTPTESDADSAGNRNLEGSKAHSGTSLTDATSRGASTSRPSAIGKKSSDEQHPDQLTILDG